MILVYNIAFIRIAASVARAWWLYVPDAFVGLVSARNAVGAPKVGGAQVKEDGIVGRGVAGPKCKVCIVELVAAM